MGGELGAGSYTPPPPFLLTPVNVVMVLTAEEKDHICPRTYHIAHGDEGFLFDFTQANVS